MRSPVRIYITAKDHTSHLELAVLYVKLMKESVEERGDRKVNQGMSAEWLE